MGVIVYKSQPAQTGLLLLLLYTKEDSHYGMEFS